MNAIAQPKRGIAGGRSSGSDIIKQRQHADPDHVHKVPIEGHILQSDVIGWSEATCKNLTQEAPEDERNADSNVETMESGDEEKARSINAAGVEPKTLMVKMGPLVALEANEEGPQENGDRKPAETRFSFVYGDFGEVEREAAGKKEDRIDRSEKNGEVGNIGARWPSVTSLPRESIQRNTEDYIATEQTCEKHGLGDQKNDHSELACGRRGSLVLLRIVGECCCRHSWLYFLKWLRRLERAANVHQYQNKCRE